MILASRLISEGFTLLTCPGKLLFQDDPLVTFRSPSESCCTDAAAGQIALPAAASLAVCSPSTSSRYRAATCSGGDQPPDTCPPSVSHALRALLHPGPAGLVSCRSRPWGFTLQGRTPLAEPNILSDVACPPGVGVFSGCRLDRLGSLGYRAYPRSPWRSCRGNGASFDTPLFRAFIPASVRFSGPIV